MYIYFYSRSSLDANEAYRLKKVPVTQYMTCNTFESKVEIFEGSKAPLICLTVDIPYTTTRPPYVNKLQKY